MVNILEVQNLRDDVIGNKPVNIPIPDSDLPYEVINILKNNNNKKGVEKRVCEILSASGDPLDTDAIIIELYRKFQYIPKSRASISNKLSFMARQSHIERVPNLRGFYRIVQS